MNIFRHSKENFFVVTLLLFFTFLFFYKLDYNTLASWDEAWYGSIAREIARTGDFINMIWNGKPYYDHPPMGFWLMALSYKIFGVSEFATRFPSTILGLLTVLLVYRTAVALFGKKILGFVSALMLGTSVWYLIRVRSGNLESVFLFFYILTVYLSIKSSKDFRWFPLTMMSFGALVLTKTLVGLSAGLLILYMNFRQFTFIKRNFSWFLLGMFLFALIVVPWYRYHLQKYPDFYEYHFVHKGTRNKTIDSYFTLMLDRPLFYIHMGIRKWYRLWQASLILLIGSLFYQLIMFIKKKKKKFLDVIKNYAFLLLWNFIILYPFLTAEETELWHLIPTYLPIMLIISVGFYDFGLLVFSRYERVFKFLFLTAVIYISIVQVRNFRKEVFPESRYTPDQVDISKRLSKYQSKIYLDGDYIPIAVFYSGKKIYSLVYESDSQKTFTNLFEIDNGKVIGVTENWVAEDLKNKKFPFKLLEKNNRYSIITKPG